MAEIERAQWLEMSDGDRESYARRLLQSLPCEASFLGLSEAALSESHSPIAAFKIDGARFVLVPGGDFAVGFDPGAWEPNDDERMSWECTAEEYELDPSPVVHL